jgi:hypothetical protein
MFGHIFCTVILPSLMTFGYPCLLSLLYLNMFKLQTLPKYHIVQHKNSLLCLGASTAPSYKFIIIYYLLVKINTTVVRVASTAPCGMYACHVSDVIYTVTFHMSQLLVDYLHKS